MAVWYVRTSGIYGTPRVNLDVSPCPSIMADGIGGGYHSQYELQDDGAPMVNADNGGDKPPYRVPLMSEVAALPWNGLTVVSTFSGAGGSCTGYRMAGYRVAWANEFLQAAQDSYRANYPDSVLDGRDVRLVRAEEILAASGLAVGELDLFDGSPPCQAFSTAGKREKGWGEAKRYENGASQCNELLFTEYIRLLRGLMPRTFVAENVSGLVKGVAKGYFKEILRDLQACGYRVSARLLDAQWLGVPQARQRIIFMGVRNDLGVNPVHPEPLRYRYTVRDALPSISNTKLRMGAHGFQHETFHDLNERPCPTVMATGLSSYSYDLQNLPERGAQIIHDTGNFASKVPIADRPCPAVTIGSGSANSTHHLVAGKGEGDTVTSRRPDGIERRKFTIDELKRICGFPDDYVLTGTYAQQWERLGNSVPPVMMSHVAAAIRDRILLPLRAI